MMFCKSWACKSDNWGIEILKFGSQAFVRCMVGLLRAIVQFYGSPLRFERNGRVVQPPSD